MGHVLVGVDGSRQAAAALRWAAWFATATGRALHVAHAWQHGQRLEPLLTDTAEAGDPAGIEEGVRERLRALVAEELGDGAPVRSHLALRGEVAAALSKEARRLEAALLVVGARGAGGALRSLLGSVSRELTECPTEAVAVVPDEAVVPEPGAPWSLVVGVDGSHGSARAVRWAAASAHRGGGEVVAVHAVEPPTSDLSPRELDGVTAEMEQRLSQEWCAPLRDLGVAHAARVDRGGAELVITRAAEAVAPAAVVVGSRGLGPVSQRLLGSVSAALVRELAWPTVVVPAPRDCVVWSAGAG